MTTHSNLMPLPPMPVYKDFEQDDGTTNWVSYNVAVAAWERVCKEVTAGNVKITAVINDIDEDFWGIWD